MFARVPLFCNRKKCCLCLQIIKLLQFLKSNFLKFN